MKSKPRDPTEWHNLFKKCFGWHENGNSTRKVALKLPSPGVQLLAKEGNCCPSMSFKYISYFVIINSHATCLVRWCENSSKSKLILRSRYVFLCRHEVYNFLHCCLHMMKSLTSLLELSYRGIYNPIILDTYWHVQPTMSCICDSSTVLVWLPLLDFFK